MFKSLSFVPSFIRVPLMAMATLTTMGLSGCIESRATEMRKALSACDNARRYSDKFCLNPNPRDKALERDCQALDRYLFKQCLYPDHYEECAGKDYGYGLVCDCMNFGRNMFGECPMR